MKLPPIFAPLREGPFARYMTGEAISMVGTWMQMFAQGYVLTTLTSEAFVLGLLTFTSGLPTLLLSLAGGSLADRADKRIILQVSLLVQLLTAAALGLLIATGQIAIWHIFVAAGVLGISTAFEMPAVSAFVPELVPKEEMANAIAIDRSVFHCTRFMGPALGGYFIAKLGTASVYYVNAASFLALIAALMTIPRRAAESAESEEARRGSFLAGLEYVRADAPTRAMVLLMASMTLFISPFLMITMPFYSHFTLGLGPDKMGWLMAVSGVGSLTGSLGLLGTARGHRALAVKLGAGAAALALLGMSWAPSFGWAAAFIVLLAIGLSTCYGTANIVIQERAPNELRGRISAVAALSFFGLIPFSGLIMTRIIDSFGMRHVMGLSAIGFGLATTLLLAGRKELSSAPPTEVAPPLDAEQ